MSDSPLILLADADPRRALLLHKHLLALGCRLEVFNDGLQVMQRLHLDGPDLLVLDAALPMLNGLEVARRLRDRGSILPIFMLCGSDRFTDRVNALDAGADEVLSFPFALEEFTARFRALIRRSSMGGNEVAGRFLIHRDLSVNTDERKVSRAGLTIKLTVKEYQLLLYLIRHKNQVVTRHQILTGVWGDTWVGDDNLLDVYIRYLRKKIERPDLAPLIKTVRGVGFMLE